MSNAFRTSAPVIPASGPVIEDGPTHDDAEIGPIAPDIIPDTPSDLAVSCMAIIEERRKGHLSLASATLQLVDLLPDNDVGNEAYGSYLDQLTEIDHERALASSRGKTTLEAVTAHDLCHVDNRTPDGAHDAVPQGDLVPTAVKHTHDHDHGPSAGGTQESPTNESLYAWSDMPIPTAALDADITKTLALKANYLTDICHTKNNLVI